MCNTIALGVCNWNEGNPSEPNRPALPPLLEDIYLFFGARDGMQKRVDQRETRLWPPETLPVGPAQLDPFTHSVFQFSSIFTLYRI